MVMPPPTEDQAWRPSSSPARLASALLTSFQRMTSSARLLLIGCFQCDYLKAGCFRRQEEHDGGAWFDCDKLQVEHPFCYVNPVATNATPTTALCHAPTPQPAPPSPPRAVRRGNPLRASPQRPPGNALTPRGCSMPEPSPPRRHKAYVNDAFVSEADSVVESVGLKDGVARYVRGQAGRSLLVESFAAKLEADLRRLEYDRQRSEGELVALGPSADSDWLKFATPKGPHGDLDSPSHYYDELGESRLGHDVWKPSELENVFECYNMAAFYSYGAVSQVGEKFASRVRGEKFEEVFPVCPRNNNNNNNNKSDGEIPSPREVDHKPVIEDEKLEYSQTQLEDLIQACVFADDITDVDKYLRRGSLRNGHCAVRFGGRTFNKLLIYNLVKATMSECAAQYPRSMAVCARYPVSLVQSKVIDVLSDRSKSEENLCGLQVFHSPSASALRDKQSARRLVVSVVAAEVKAEAPRWQDFHKEEAETKEAVVNEVLHDLISDTTNVFQVLLAKKIQSQQRV